MASQMKVWTASSQTVTRVEKDGSPKQGCGQNKRLYVGRIGNYDYRSWLKFNLDWTNVGKVVRATLVTYTDDFLGLNETSASEVGKDTPAVRVRRLTGGFTEGNNADEDFDSSDYRPGSTTGTGEVKFRMTEEANGINRIDITSIVNAWAPANVKRSNGSTGAPAKNYGIALLEWSKLGDTLREWSGWSRKAADSSMRPTIELVYEYGGTTPNTPTALTPSGTVVSIGSFEGDFSDPRASDKLAHSEVQVYSPGHSATGEADDNNITDTAHGLVAGDAIYFTSLTGGAGLTTFTKYYVRVRVDANRFRVATSMTANSIDITTDYSAMTWRTLVYSKKQAESNAAIVAGRFDHIPENLHLVKNASYVWRARVFDNEGKASAWTGLVTVAVSNTDPDPPVLSPDGSSYATLDGIQFKGGTFSDPDAGDTLLAYQVQMTSYAEGAPQWDEPDSLLWDTGKRFVVSGATDWATPYGGQSLDAGTYYWRARQWDAHQGLSSWEYASVILTEDFVSEPNDSVNAIQMRPRAPWRILIKEMKFNTIGGNITGNSGTDLLTSASAHGMAAGRRIRFSSLTGGTGLFTGKDYYVLATGLTTTAFKVSETLGGSVVSFSTNVTAGTLTAITTRGPGNVVAVIEDAFNVGASMLYNSPGELHFTLGISHPQISVIEPRQTHYAVEFRQGDGWREVFAGLMMDFDASATDVVFYGTDYLGLLDFSLDENYDPANIEKSSDNGGSKYVNKTISHIVTDQLSRARTPTNSPVGFISTGSIASMPALVTIYSTYQPTLPFVVGLIDSHRAGSGKRTRLQVRKTTSGGYEFVVQDDPGIIRPDMRMRYGELVQGYRVIPFGKSWATRVSAVGRDKSGLKVRYASSTATGIDETVWGRWTEAQFIDGVADANDMVRRTRQAVLTASKLGKQIALGIRSGVLQPRDGYDLLDQFLVDIEHGSVSTTALGSGYWVAVGITWQALQRGDLNTTLTLHPREDGTAPDADLLIAQPISTQNEWQVGYQPPVADIIRQIGRAMDTGRLLDDGHLFDSFNETTRPLFTDLSTGNVYELSEDGETWTLIYAPSTPPAPDPATTLVDSRVTTNSAGVKVANITVQFPE